MHFNRATFETSYVWVGPRSPNSLPWDWNVVIDQNDAIFVICYWNIVIDQNGTIIVIFDEISSLLRMTKSLSSASYQLLSYAPHFLTWLDDQLPLTWEDPASLCMDHPTSHFSPCTLRNTLITICACMYQTNRVDLIVLTSCTAHTLVGVQCTARNLFHLYIQRHASPTHASLPSDINKR